MTINQRIKQLRKESKMSQKRLSGELGITQGALSQIELGSVAPSIEIIRKIAELFKEKYDWIIDGVETSDDTQQYTYTINYKEQCKILEFTLEQKRIEIVESL